LQKTDNNSTDILQYTFHFGQKGSTLPGRVSLISMPFVVSFLINFERHNIIDIGIERQRKKQKQENNIL
jgi:hypothetical protein